MSIYLSKTCLPVFACPFGSVLWTGRSTEGSRTGVSNAPSYATFFFLSFPLSFKRGTTATTKAVDRTTAQGNGSHYVDAGLSFWAASEWQQDPRFARATPASSIFVRIPLPRLDERKQQSGLPRKKEGKKETDWGRWHSTGFVTGTGNCQLEAHPVLLRLNPFNDAGLLLPFGFPTSRLSLLRLSCDDFQTSDERLKQR